MVKKKPEIGLVLIVTAGVLVLSAVSAWNARGKLRGVEAAADRQGALLETAVAGQVAHGEALRKAVAAKLDAADSVHAALEAASVASATATGMAGRAAAYTRWRDAVTACLATAEARPDLQLEVAAGKDFVAADPELQKLADAYNRAAKTYNIQIRKNPDTRLAEGLKLKPREFFGAAPQ